MPIEAWITLGVLIIVLVMLVGTRRSPDVIIWGGVALLLTVPFPKAGGWTVGVLDTHGALAGLANEGVVTIAVLFVFAAALTETGGMNWLVNRMLGRPKTMTEAQVRIMAPTAAMSAFLNNTPLVAMLLPVIGDWSRRMGHSASRLLMPLSFASILGGACTLIGTSTNLIVNGWLIEETDHGGLDMFEIAKVGLPIAIVGIGFVLVANRWLLPDRTPAFSADSDAREYTVEMMVEDGPLAGKTIEQAGLRHLPGLYLVEIDREGQVMAAVSPNVKLRAGDRLVFVGVIESVVDLQTIRGLAPATNQVYKLNEARTNRTLVEAVVSNTCPLVGRTIREGRFRTVYNAAVIAVARNGERITDRKLGDIRLKTGDTLLLEARASFADAQRNNRDFYLVSNVNESRFVKHDKAWVALLLLGALVGLVTLTPLSMLQAAVIVAGLSIITRCTTATAARQAIDWQVLLVIAGALGLGKAMDSSGLAAALGDQLHIVVGNNEYAMLAAIFVLTAVLASVVTAKAAAVLMLPIAVAAATGLSTPGIDVSYMPFVIAVMVAAATTVATPIGYPTNLMVYGPGGYRFTDYLRMGLPLTAIVAAMSVWLIPEIWPFVAIAS